MADSDLPPGCKELPNGEIVLPPFYILDEHSFTDSQDGEVVNLDPQRLQRIASNANRRRVRTGDESPIILGHTDDDLPEKHQPEIVGRAVNWEVVPFFDVKNPDGKPKQAIRVIPIAKDRQAMEIFKKFPRRSVEYWKNTDEIDPIALLGATTPKRDLGYHKFSRQGRPYLYSCGVTKMDMAPNDPQGGGNSALIAEIMQSAPMKEILATCGMMKQFIEAQGGMGGEDPNAMPGMGEDPLGGMNPEGMNEGDTFPGMDAAGGDEPAGLPSRGEDDDDEEEKPRKTEMAAKYKRQDTQIAESYRRGEIGWRQYLDLVNAKDKVEKQQVTRMSRRTTNPEPDEETQVVDRVTKAKFSAVERDYKTKFQAQEARIQQLEKQNLLQEIEATLTRLAEVDLIDFDPEEEKNTLIKMHKKADRDAYVEKMKKRYSRRNPGNPVLLEGLESRPERMSRTQVDPNAPQNADEGIMMAIHQAEANNKGKTMSADEAIKIVRQKSTGVNGTHVKVR